MLAPPASEAGIDSRKRLVKSGSGLSGASSEGGQSSTSGAVERPRIRIPESLQELLPRLVEAGVEEFDLSDRAVAAEDIELLQKCLLDRREQLRELRLVRAGLNPAAFSAVGDLVGNCLSINVLDIGGNLVSCPDDIGGSFARGVLKGKSGRAIRHLSLAGCLLKDEGMDAVCHIFGFFAGPLDKDPMIEVLDLCSNRIGIEGLKKLQRGFEQNVTLTRLNLSANCLGPESTQTLIECLNINKGRLKTLDLSQNLLLSEGVQTLARHFVSADGRLEYLNLSHNQVPLADLEQLRGELEKPSEGLLKGWLLQFDNIAGPKRQLCLNAF